MCIRDRPRTDKISIQLSLESVMNTIEVFTYMEFIRKMTQQEITKERLSLLRLINGDCFFPLAVWPKSTIHRFFKKPHNDQDTMVLFLFFSGM